MSKIKNNNSRFSFIHALIISSLFALAFYSFTFLGNNAYSHPISRLLLAGSATSLLVYMGGFFANFNLGPIRAGGSVALLFSIFYLLSLDNQGNDSLNGQLKNNIEKIETTMKDGTNNYRNYPIVDKELLNGIAIIDNQRPIVAKFIKLNNEVLKWRLVLVHELGAEYNKANEAKDKVGFEDLYEKLNTLEDVIGTEPKYVLYYASVLKRLIEMKSEHIKSVENTFKKVINLVNNLRGTKVQYISDIYRITANAMRRIAEDTKSIELKRDQLDKAEEFLRTGDEKAQRTIDPILNNQSRGNIFEVRGNYERSFLYFKKAIDHFNKGDSKYVKTRENNLPNYYACLTEILRVMSVLNKPVKEMKEYRKQLDLADPELRALSDIYISLSHSEYYTKSLRDSLATQSLDLEAEELLNVIKARMESSNGNFNSAKSLLENVLTKAQKFKRHREVLVLKKWIKKMENKKTFSGNLLTLSKFPVL